jgi:hypothetical protein
VDKAALVRSDLDAEGRLLNALSLAKIPTTLVDFDFVAPLDEWHLVVATPLYDDKGPREAYSKIIKALQDAGIYKEIRIRIVSVKSPSDPSVKALAAEVKVKTEGTIHILEVGGPSEPLKPTQYLVTFAPFAGPGGAVPSRRFQRPDQLKTFLEDQVGINPSSVDEAFSDLHRKGSASIFHVQLTRREAKRLGLA